MLVAFWPEDQACFYKSDGQLQRNSLHYKYLSPLVDAVVVFAEKQGKYFMGQLWIAGLDGNIQ